MDIINNVYCLFEQSGVFKNAFKELGLNAFDFDIKNDFNQTDFCCDIFKQIDCYFKNDISIFDKFTNNDLIMCFFPCVRFSHQMLLNFKGLEPHLKNYTKDMLMLKMIDYHNELNILYIYFCKLCFICYHENLKCIIENPYNKSHYLVNYFPIPATFIDMDRSKDGDYYKKPTQFWFINFNPKNNFLFDPIPCINPTPIIKESNRVKRSLISPYYANRFIRKYILSDD